jgi:phenylacetic acid degradation operon negative regulatory protein
MPLAGLLAALRDAPSRTGSVIITLYGDAIAPRGGELALASLLELMAALGANGGVVRTAVSRLSRDGWLEGHRDGRRSFYRLSRRGILESSEAGPRIYGPLDSAWNGQLRLAFAEAGVERTMLEQAGYALLAPGVLAAPDTALTPPPGIPALLSRGTPETMRTLAARAWPVARVGTGYSGFVELFSGLDGLTASLQPLDALAARTLLIHEYRRVTLRDPRLPAGLLPADWPGAAARTLCVKLYRTLATASERWLDTAENRSGPLPGGPDPAARFSGGDKQPAAPA